MCETKPGPRCSSDTRKTLAKAIKLLEKAELNVREASQQVIAAGNNYRNHPGNKTLAEYTVANMNLELAEANFEAVKTVKKEKQLQFYSTPEGMEYLKAETDAFSAVTLSAAQEYREFQKELSKKIKSFPDPETQQRYIRSVRNMLNKERFNRNQLIVDNSTGKPDPKVFGYQVSADYLKLLIDDLDEITVTPVGTR